MNFACSVCGPGRKIHLLGHFSVMSSKTGDAYLHTSGSSLETCVVWWFMAAAADTFLIGRKLIKIPSLPFPYAFLWALLLV